MFVSSTFADLRAERDALARKVFPSIRRRCEQRGVTFAEVDLRWGITSEEVAEGQVLPLCLSEIDRCRPGFLILLGERYGWTPDSIPADLTAREPWLAHPQFQGASVTEIEIHHGLLRWPETAEHALCYIRTSPSHGEIPDPGVEARRRLGRLKEAVRDSGCLVREYASDAALIALASDDLERLVDAVVPRLEGLSPTEQERRAHAAYASGRSRVFIDPPGGFDTLERHVAGTGSPLVITGAAGAGKTTWMAGWLKWRAVPISTEPRRRLTWWSRGGPATPVPIDWTWSHFAQATPASSNWSSLVERFVDDVQARTGNRIEFTDEPARMRAAYGQALAAASRDGRVLIVLDGVDRIETSADLGWLPPELPDQIRLVVTLGPGRGLERLRARGWTVRDAPSWPLPDRERFVASFLRHYGKRLPSASTTRIASDPRCERLFFLRTLLDELRLTGRFETLDNDLSRYLSAGTEDELVDLVLSRLESDDGEFGGIVQRLLVLLRASHGGLAEPELLEAAGTAGDRVPPAMWSRLRAACGDAVQERSGFISIAHNVWRRAIDRRYLPTPEPRRVSAARLAALFESAPVQRQVDELAWQHIAAGNRPALRTVVLSADFLEAAWVRVPHDLQSWWTQAFADTGTSPPTDAELAQLSGRSAQRIAGLLLRRIGQSGAALAIAEQVAAAAGRIGDEALLESALNDLALVLRERGDRAAALVALQQQEALCRRRGDEPALRVSLGNQAVVLKELGASDAALGLLNTLVDSSRAALDEAALASALTNRAELLVRDRPQEALRALREAEDLFRAVGDRDGLAAALGNLAVVEAETNHPQRSEALHEEEEAIYTALGDWAGVARASSRQATLALRRQDFDRALRLARRARAIGTSAPPWLMIQCLSVEASVLYNLGFPDRARPLLAEASAVARLHPDVPARELDELRTLVEGVPPARHLDQ